MAVDKDFMQSRNPWNGLRTYVEGEVIYGRGEEILVLSQQILQASQTVLYGRSGIGKSSILNAGIFPILRKRGCFPVYIRFEHNVDVSYLQQVQAAIYREVEKSNGAIIATEVVEASANETLWTFFHRIEYCGADGNKLKPVIVFDQFEEIFTLEQNRDKISDFFGQLADLINNVMPEYLVEKNDETYQQNEQTQSLPNLSDDGMIWDLLDSLQTDTYKYISESNFHIVFTLREDFLSYLERNTTGIPALKNNRHCLQPINDEQAAEIILQPRPGLVTTEVAKLIIQKVTGEENFEIDGIPEIQVDSAILSLYLSRLYDRMILDGRSEITSELVEAHSQNIIEDFYTDAVQGLADSSVQWLEDTLVNEDGRRDNRDRLTVLRESGISEHELSRLVNDVKLLRQFSYGGDLRIEFIHDVLSPVIEERRRKRAELQGIKEIEAKAQLEKKRLRKKIKWSIISCVAIAFLAFAASICYWYWNEKSYSEYYADFSLKAGWPVGEGERLDENARAHMPLYYKLTRRGLRNGHFTEVTVCSSNTMLPSYPRLNWLENSDNERDVKGSEFNKILSSVAKIKFVAGDNDRVANMTLIDADENPLLVMTYFYTDKNDAWLNYLTPSGQSFEIRDNGVDRSRLVWDSVGRISSMRFFSADGIPRYINQNYRIAGYTFKYPNNQTQFTYYLDEYGQTARTMPYNVKSVSKSNGVITTSYMFAMTPDATVLKLAKNELGYSREVKNGNKEELFEFSKVPTAQCISTFDERGNILEQRFSGNSNAKVPSVIKWRYKGDTGLEIEKIRLTKDDRPFGTNADDIYREVKDYDEKGGLIRKNLIALNKDTLYRYDVDKKQFGDSQLLTITEIDKINGKNLIIKDSISRGGKDILRAYFDEKLHPINVKAPWGEDSVAYHSVRMIVNGKETISHYRVVSQDGRWIIPMPVTDGALEMTCAFERKIIDEGDKTIEQISTRDGKIVKRMLYFKQGGQVVGRAACSILDNTPVRCPNWESDGFGYYVIYFAKNFEGNYSVLQAYNEFGGLAPLWVYNGYKTVKNKSFKGESLGNGYTVLNRYFQSVFEPDKQISNAEIPYLHILSKKSVLNREKGGLLDGDRIIALGRWRYGDPMSLLATEWGKLSDASQTVHIKVLRPQNSGLKVVEFDTTGKKDESQLSEYHVFALTNNEKQLIESVIKKIKS